MTKTTPKKSGRPMLPASGLGITIRTARLGKSMSLRELGPKCGVTYAHLSEIERGAEVSLPALRRIAKALDLQLHIALTPTK